MFPARYAHLFHSSLDHGDPRWKAHPPLLPLWSSLALSTLTILLTAPFLSSSPEIKYRSLSPQNPY